MRNELSGKYLKSNPIMHLVAEHSGSKMLEMSFPDINRDWIGSSLDLNLVFRENYF